MNQSRVLSIVAILFAWSIPCGSAIAQDQPFELFRVSNHSDKPITVSIRARGRGTRFTGWQAPLKIDAGFSDAIQLEGFEPFDIAIELGAGHTIVANGVMLCTWMKKCRETGDTDWVMEFRSGQWVYGQGKPKFQWHAKANNDAYRAIADDASIDLQFGIKIAGADAPRPPRIPPRRK